MVYFFFLIDRDSAFRYHPDPEHTEGIRTWLGQCLKALHAVTSGSSLYRSNYDLWLHLHRRIRRCKAPLNCPGKTAHIMGHRATRTVTFTKLLLPEQGKNQVSNCDSVITKGADTCCKSPAGNTPSIVEVLAGIVSALLLPVHVFLEPSGQGTCLETAEVH